MTNGFKGRAEHINHSQRLHENHPEFLGSIKKIATENIGREIEGKDTTEGGKGQHPQKYGAFVTGNKANILATINPDLVDPSKMTTRENIEGHKQTCALVKEEIMILIQKINACIHTVLQKNIYSIEEVGSLLQTLLFMQATYQHEYNHWDKYTKQHPKKDPRVPKQQITTWESNHTENMKFLKETNNTIDNILYPQID